MSTMSDADVLKICEIVHHYGKERLNTRGYELIAICLTQIQENLTPQNFSLLDAVVYDSDVLFAHKPTRRIFNFFYSSRKKDIVLTVLTDKGLLRSLVEVTQHGHHVAKDQAHFQYLKEEIGLLKERLGREQDMITDEYKFVIECKSGRNFVLHKAVLRTVEYFDLLHRHCNTNDNSHPDIKTIWKQHVKLEFSRRAVEVCMKYIHGFETNHETFEYCSFSDLFDIHIMSDQMNLTSLKSISFEFIKHYVRFGIVDKLHEMKFFQGIICIYNKEDCYAEMRELLIEMMKKSVNSLNSSEWISLCEKNGITPQDEPELWLEICGCCDPDVKELYDISLKRKRENDEMINLLIQKKEEK